MQTLSYGYQLPESGDKGTTLWTALETDITQLNYHAHDGSTSAAIPGNNIGSTQQAISHTNWAGYGGPTGHYRQLVTMSPGYSFDTKNVQFRTAGGEYLYPTIVKNDNTSFYIFTTDNTLDLVANYGG